MIDNVPLESLLGSEAVSPILQFSSEDSPTTANHQDKILDIVTPTHLVETKEQEKLKTNLRKNVTIHRFATKKPPDRLSGRNSYLSG